MRRIITTALFAALIMVGTQAKDIKTMRVTTTPKMHCESCEKRIKGNLRYEKGVKQIDTNVDEQVVTIKYDADKTTPELIVSAFEKFDYTAYLLPEDKQPEQPAAQEEEK